LRHGQADVDVKNAVSSVSDFASATTPNASDPEGAAGGGRSALDQHADGQGRVRRDHRGERCVAEVPATRHNHATTTLQEILKKKRSEPTTQRQVPQDCRVHQGLGAVGESTVLPSHIKNWPAASLNRTIPDAPGRSIVSATPPTRQLLAIGQWNARPGVERRNDTTP
jgi:hypothetical protein